MKIAELKQLNAFPTNESTVKAITWNGNTFEIGIKPISYGQMLDIQKDPETSNAKMIAASVVLEGEQFTVEDVLRMDVSLAGELLQAVLLTLAEKKAMNSATTGTKSQSHSAARSRKPKAE